MKLRPQTVFLVIGLSVLVGLTLAPRLPRVERAVVDRDRDLPRHGAQPGGRGVRASGHEAPLGSEPRLRARAPRAHRHRLPRRPAARHAGERVRRTQCPTSSTISPPGGARSAGSRTSTRSSTASARRSSGRAQAACSASGAGVLDVVRSVVTAVVGVDHDHLPHVLHAPRGPADDRGILRIVPESARPRYERVGRDIYRSISGYVTGNLLISLLAGILVDDRALRRRERVRDRARPARRDPRPHSARRRDARGDHRLDGHLHRDRLGSLRDRHRLLHRLPAVREPRRPAARLRAGRCSSRPLRCSARCSSAHSSQESWARCSRFPSRAR